MVLICTNAWSEGACLTKHGLHKAIFGFSDISREKSRELERYAYSDPVTGGDNYVYFKQKLEEKTQKGYIVSMDIHSFKVVNSI